MSDHREYVPRVDESDAPGVAGMLWQALHFGSPWSEKPQRWLEKVGPNSLRAVRIGGRIAAALRVIDMEQWFGGRSIRTAAINAVGVAPEHRGSGVGLFLMRKMLEEVRDSGFPISTLYPATTAFYRRAGYERAGSRIVWDVPTDMLPTRERTCEIRPADEGDQGTIRELAAERGRTTNGNLDRGEVMWSRLFGSGDERNFVYLVLRDSRPEGYLIYQQGGQWEPIKVQDACALTPPAMRQILAFLGGHRSLVPVVKLPGGPVDALLFLTPEQRCKTDFSLEWVVRIVDVQAALAARGYSPLANGTLHLDIDDPDLPWNHGRFTLRVEDGRAEACAGGDRSLRTTIRGLAALYTGHLHPLELQAIGLLDGPMDALALAGALFAGPRPWMPDMF